MAVPATPPPQGQTGKQAIGQSSSTITLLTRTGCHLCVEVAAELNALGIAFATIDVDQDIDLERRYSEAVPVLLRGAEELGRAPFTAAALREALQAFLPGAPCGAPG